MNRSGKSPNARRTPHVPDSPSDAIYVRLGKAAHASLALMRLCRYNTARVGTPSPQLATPFHAFAEPPMDVCRYIERILKHAEATETGVLLGLCLAGRYAAVTGTPLTTLCAHRLVLASIMVGVKAHMDRFRSNRTYARVGGVSLAELNELEVELLVALDHRVTVSKQELDAMCASAGRAAGMSWVANAAHDAAACATKAFVARGTGLPCMPRAAPLQPTPPSRPNASPSPGLLRLPSCLSSRSALASMASLSLEGALCDPCEGSALLPMPAVSLGSPMPSAAGSSTPSASFAAGGGINAVRAVLTSGEDAPSPSLSLPHIAVQ